MCERCELLVREPRCDHPIRAGTAKLWLAACRDQGRQPGHQEGKKGREKLLRGVWYSFYGKSTKHDGPKRRPSGAAAAPGTRPAQYQAGPRKRLNAETRAGSARGATAGGGVRIGDGF